MHTQIQTDTKVTTMGTLSGVQELFLQPIIKEPSCPKHEQISILKSINLVSVHVFLSHLKSQLHEIFAQGVIWLKNLKYDTKSPSCLENVGVFPKISVFSTHRTMKL